MRGQARLARSWPPRVDYAAPAGLPPQAYRVAQQYDHVGWLVCFASLTMLLLIQWATKLPAQWAQTVAVLMFLAPWGVIVLARPHDAYRSVIRNWPLLALPLLALLSVLWSGYPDWTLRASLQFIVTMVVGIWAGTCVKPRALLSALLSTLLLLAIMSVLSGQVDRDRFTGEYTLIGVFGSKNYFALCVSLLLLSGVAVVFDRTQPRIFRMTGLAGIALAPPLLVYARSAGALVTSVVSLMVIFCLRAAIRLRPAPRIAVLITVLLFVLTVPLVASLGLGYEEFLALFGKNATLTGRIVLWQQAINSIADQPWLGVGYQAFWQVGNWPAEQLWLYASMANKYGYHFHNTYLQVGVDLGFAGLSLFIMVFIIIISRIVISLSGPPLRSEHLFAIGLFVFLILRTPIEVDLFFQFQIASILLCLIFVYLQPFALFHRKNDNAAAGYESEVTHGESAFARRPGY